MTDRLSDYRPIDYTTHYRLQENIETGRWRIVYRRDGSPHSRTTYRSERAARKALKYQIAAMQRAQVANGRDRAVEDRWEDR